MTFHFCGYFPKRATPRPDGYDLPGVVDIASVSHCIAKRPEDWIESWTFNALGFFDDVDAAESVVPESDQSQFDVYAYEFLDESFVGGLAEPWTVPPLACKLPGQRLRAPRIRRGQQVQHRLLGMQSPVLQRQGGDLQGECALSVRRTRGCGRCYRGVLEGRTGAWFCTTLPGSSGGAVP